MSRETIKWLNENVLVGYTEKRVPAWWAEEGYDNHFEGPVPLERVHNLFDFDILDADVLFENAVTGKIQGAPNQKVYYRSDNGMYLSSATNGHKGHDYREWLVSHVSTLLDATLHIGQAGLLRNGAIGWVSIEMEETMSAAGMDFRPQLLATTSWDGSIKTTYKNVATIVVCDNTRDMALRENGESYGVKHTKNSEFKVLDARKALNIMETFGDGFGSEIDQLSKIEVSAKDLDNFLKIYIPMPDEGKGKTQAQNKIEKMLNLYRFDVRCSPWQNTALGVVQMANTYLYHESSVKGGEAVRPERNMWRAITPNKAEAVGTFDGKVMDALATALGREQLLLPA